jgi:hypothetical protein
MQTQPANVWARAQIEPRSALALRLVVACALLLVVPLPLAAQSGSGETGTEAGLQTIRVVLVGAEPVSTFSRRLASWFASTTRVTVRNESRLDADRILGPKDESGVYVWIELRSSALGRVYFVVSEKNARQRFLVRDVALENGLDELGVERLAQVIYSSVLALWQGRVQSPQAEVERRLASSADAKSEVVSAASSTAAAAEPSPSEPLQQPPCPSPGYALSAGYGLNARGDEGPAHGPQLWAALLGGCVSVRFGGYLSARYLIPVERSVDDVSLSLTGGRMRLGGLLEHIVSKAFRLEVGGGVGGDVVRYEPTASAGLEAARGATEVRPVVTLLIGSRFLAGVGGIAVFGELDMQLEDTHYDVSRRAGLQTVLAPWQLQPGVSALICFDGPNP